MDSKHIKRKHRIDDILYQSVLTANRGVEIRMKSNSV